MATTQLPEPRHLHAVVCEWFDRSVVGYDGVAHHDGIKPYRLSAPTSRDGVLGVEINALTDDISERLYDVIDGNRFIRLGRQQVAVGDPLVLDDVSWDELARTAVHAGVTWRVHFLTPTVFRTGKHTHVLPTPALVLRGAATAWDLFSDVDRKELPRETNSSVLVTDLVLQTESIHCGSVRHTGLTGYADYRCVSGLVADAVAPLFSLLPFTSVGSHKGKGLGCVEVEQRQVGARSKRAITADHHRSQATRPHPLGGHEPHHEYEEAHHARVRVRRPHASV